MYPLKIKEKYDSNNLEKLSNRFSTAYLGNYKSGDFREGVGSHPGVDIVPIEKGQDVFSVLDGKVFKCGVDGAYGNYVFIEHSEVPHPDNFSQTTTLYSCYLHLSKVDVKIGDVVKEGTKIGNTGNTGLSFGEHLHFQIDKKEAPYHSYWPYTAQEAKTAGVSFSGGVDLALGIDKAKMYTINPLIYLDKVAELKPKNSSTTETKVTEEKIPKTQPEIKEIKIDGTTTKPENTTNNTGEVVLKIKKDDNVILSNNSDEILSGVKDNNKTDKFFF